MALVKGTNSYVTVAEADAYFQTRIDSTVWSEAADENKVQALVTATSVLDEMAWAGIAVSADQQLAFPRNGNYFDPKLGQTVVFKDVPDRIVNACYEQALHILSNQGLFDSTGSVTDLQVGSIVLTTIVTPSVVSPTAKRLVSPMLANGGSKQWWRAN